MATYKVTTPEAGHTGAVGNVDFVKGESIVDDATHSAELAYFRGAGYGVEPYRKPRRPTAAAEALSPDMPADDASEAVWRIWAVQHGGLTVEEVNGMGDVAKIIEAVKKGQTP